MRLTLESVVFDDLVMRIMPPLALKMKPVTSKASQMKL